MTDNDLANAHKSECLELEQMMDRVKKYPGGIPFLVDLFMAILAEQGLTVIPAVFRAQDLRIVVNNYVPPNTVVIHASTEECLRVWRENQ